MQPDLSGKMLVGDGGGGDVFDGKVSLVVKYVGGDATVNVSAQQEHTSVLLVAMFPVKTFIKNPLKVVFVVRPVVLEKVHLKSLLLNGLRIISYKGYLCCNNDHLQVRILKEGICKKVAN